MLCKCNECTFSRELLNLCVEMQGKKHNSEYPKFYMSSVLQKLVKEGQYCQKYPKPNELYPPEYYKNKEQCMYCYHFKDVDDIHEAKMCSGCGFHFYTLSQEKYIDDTFRKNPNTK